MQKVLIVDDNEANLYLLEALMTGHGYEVVRARNGAEALEQARASPPDLVVSDILMPGMDGFALCREWRLDQRLKRIPFVFYTATYTDPKDEQFALSLGADRFIIKPAEPEPFIQAIEEVAARHESRQLTVHAETQPSETSYLKDYNEALIRKLEDKLDQLAEKNSFNQAILNAITALVAVVDEQGRLLAINNAWEHYAREEDAPQFMRAGIGANLLEIGHPYLVDITDLSRRITTGIRQVIDRKLAEFESEFSNRTHSGEQWFLMRVTPLGQAAAGAVIACFDITARKRMEEELQETGRRKDEFLAMLSHELRNPLAPVLCAAQILKLIGPKDPVLQKNRDIIERQVGHMARLLDDLLDVARITRNQIRLDKERLDLRTVVRQSIELAEHSLGGRLTLHYTYPAEPLWVCGDYTRLEQMVGNLISNAIKYTDEGRIDVNLVGGSAFEPTGWAILRVRDTGIGITPEMLPRIFELFMQADQSLDRKRGGLGIGLTMVERIVAMHDGRVEAHSEGAGKGSEFIVYLPLLETLAGECEPREDSSTAVTASTRAGNESLRILVVDDNFDAAHSLADVLRVWGYAVTTVHDGETALKRSLETFPDVILLDLGLPGMNGFEVALRLRRDSAMGSVKIIALTGYGQDEDKQRAKECGFDAHLLKPVDLDELKQLLARLSVPGTGV